MQGDPVAVGIGEGECAAEGAVDGLGDDGVPVGGESVVDDLDIGGVQPDRGTDAGLGGGIEIGAGHEVAQREGDGLRLEDDGVWRTGPRADETEVVLVERLRGGEVARLERDEVGAGDGLARGAFVTRQTMNVLLQALERDGFVTQPAEAPVGKALPTRLTPSGRRSLEQASAAVRSVERRMLAAMSEAEQADALRALKSMVGALRASGG